MKLSLHGLFAALCVLLPGAVGANTLYKCTDASGVILLTNQKVSGRNCIILSQTASAPPIGMGNAYSGSGSSTTRPKASSNPTPGDFPRISGNEQKARDTDRRAILDKELASEMQNLDKAKKQLADAGNQPATAQQPLRDTVALHERNVEALKKEIGNIR